MLRRSEELERVVRILDHVAVVTTPEHVGVVAFAAGQVIVARPPIKRVGVDHPIDCIVAYSLGVLENLL